MRYDQFGEGSLDPNIQAHYFNTTVPGVIGYRPQTWGTAGERQTLEPEDFSGTGGNDIGPQPGIRYHLK